MDRAAEAAGEDLTEFVVTHATDAARQVLADREHFDLDESTSAEQTTTIRANSDAILLNCIVTDRNAGDPCAAGRGSSLT